MANVWVYSLVSVVLVSLISFIGVFFLSVNKKRLHKILIYFVSFAAGALFGDAFLHLLPNIIEKYGFSLSISVYVLLGIVIFFILEKVVYWRHCHFTSLMNMKLPPLSFNIINQFNPQRAIIPKTR